MGEMRMWLVPYGLWLVMMTIMLLAFWGCHAGGDPSADPSNRKWPRAFGC